MGLSLGEIEQLFAAKGARMYAGEPVTQLQHALQSAELAERAGTGDELVLAGRCDAPGAVPIGFGPCRGVVVPALG